MPQSQHEGRIGKEALRQYNDHAAYILGLSATNNSTLMGTKPIVNTRWPAAGCCNNDRLVDIRRKIFPTATGVPQNV